MSASDRPRPFFVHVPESDALLLTLLGMDDVAVYDGSLEEWARDPACPMESGPATP